MISPERTAHRNCGISPHQYVLGSISSLRQTASHSIDDGASTFCEARPGGMETCAWKKSSDVSFRSLPRFSGLAHGMSQSNGIRNELVDHLTNAWSDPRTR